MLVAVEQAWCPVEVVEDRCEITGVEASGVGAIQDCAKAGLTLLTQWAAHYLGGR